MLANLTYAYTGGWVLYRGGTHVALTALAYRSTYVDNCIGQTLPYKSVPGTMLLEGVRQGYDAFRASLTKKMKWFTCGNTIGIGVLPKGATPGKIRDNWPAT